MAETNPSLDLAHQQSEHQNQLVSEDIAILIDRWIELEQKGEQFPVPFDIAWQIAGYSTKGNGKRKLTNKKSNLVDHSDYLIRSDKSSLDGRSEDLIRLTCDAFKHFCLIAETEQGRLIRQYFIDAEKKWRLVQKVNPQFAEEIEILKLKQDIAVLESQKAQAEAQKAIAEEKTISLRHAVVTTMPKAIADRVLGVTEVRDIEYRRTIVDNTGFVLNAGNTKTKGALCEEFGFVTRNGKPDYKAINALVEDAIACGAIPNPWREVRTLASLEFDAELVPTLKQFYESSPRKRQLWLGETRDKTGVNRE